jgi:hypothetical protein
MFNTGIKTEHSELAILIFAAAALGLLAISHLWRRVNQCVRRMEFLVLL